jgi:cytochrome P450
MFSPKKISGLEPLRQRLANEMVAEVREEMKERRVVVLRDILQKGSLSNVLESVFGSDVSIEREELGFMVKEGFDLIAEFNLDDYFPLRFLDFHGVKRRCCQLAGKVNSVVGQIVKERKGAGDSRSGSDFLSALLSLPEEDQLNESDMVALLWVKDSPFLLAKS